MDTDSYKKIDQGNCTKRAQKFNKDIRKILKRTPEGKSFLYSIEEDPVNPKMYGLPKTHKIGIPMRTITSGCGSAPHKLARILAQQLSSCLGTISDSHLNNSQDLKQRLKNTNFRNKKLVSFDIKSMFTNVPTNEALKVVEKFIENKPDLKLPKKDFMELLEACVTFNVFTFNECEYEQVHGLAMGSPLSPVLAQLFMENLEAGPIRDIIGPHVKWFRYVDDTLVVLNRRQTLDTLLVKLNGIHPKISFTMEEEVDGKIPFLDTMIHREKTEVKLSVYRKLTNKDDYIHYFSGHDIKTKRGIVIGFYLRALRICDDDFLKDEIKYINDAFSRLRYPNTLLKECLNKARKIRQNSCAKAKPDLYVVTPPNDGAQHIQKSVGKKIAIISKCGSRIMDITRKKQKTTGNENSLVYEVPCKDCDLVYIGETHIGLKKRMGYHIRDLRHSTISNALVKHREATSHRINTSEARILESQIPNRTLRVLKESVHIGLKKNFNIQKCSHRISQYVSSCIGQNAT